MSSIKDRSQRLGPRTYITETLKVISSVYVASGFLLSLLPVSDVHTQAGAAGLQ